MGERQFSPKDARDDNYQRRRKRKKCWPKSSRRTRNARSLTGLGCQNQNEQQQIGKPTGEVTPRLKLILPSGQLVSIKRQAVNVTNAATFMPASWYYPALEQQSEEEHSGNEPSLSDSFDDTPTDSAFDMTVGGATRTEAHDFFDFTVGGMPLEKEQSGVSCCMHSINDTESCCSCSSRERTVSPESQSHSTTSILSMSTSDDGSSTNHVEDRGLRQHERRSWSEWGSAVDPLSLHHPQNPCILDRTAEQFSCFYDDWCVVSSERSAEKEPQELTWSYKLSPPLHYCTTLTDRTEAEMNSLFEFDFLPDQLNAEVAAQQALQEWFGPFIDGLMRMQRVPSQKVHRVTAEKLGGSVRIDPEVLQEAEASLQKIAYFYSLRS